MNEFYELVSYQREKPFHSENERVQTSTRMMREVMSIKYAIASLPYFIRRSHEIIKMQFNLISFAFTNV